MTTDGDFLQASASRRNAWKVLLPASGLLALGADLGSQGFGNLAILDAYATVALLAVGWLPPGRLLSDLVIALVHAIFYCAHGVVQAREQEAPDSSGVAVQVFSMFAMAWAGVHSVALLGFSVFVALASNLLHCGSIEQLVVGVYVMAVACFAERRLAMLIHNVQGSDFGYKALDLTTEQDLLAPDSPRYSVEPLMAGDKGEAEAVHSDAEAAHSENEAERGRQTDAVDQDQESLQSIEPPAHSRSSFVDVVLTHVAPKVTSRRTSRAEEMLSRLTPVFSRPRPRFAAAQVQVPGAASHEAPAFAESLVVQDSLYALDSMSIPSTARSSETQAKRVQILSDWSNEGSERPGTSRASPRASPRAASPRAASPSAASPASPSQPVVLRGVKLTGFNTPQFNALFIESRDKRSNVNGRETYWTEVGDYFIYHSKATNTWGLAKSKRFLAITNGTSNGVAHSPAGFELWAKGARALGGWREWDPKAGKWLARPTAGIENRGKVRLKEASPLEKAVQTELALRDQGCQTDPL